MPQLPEQSVDLVFSSPPYEDCRTYGIGFKLKGQEWVDWMVEVFRQALRICKGLVAFVVEGKTRKFRYSATPALLMADLHRAGIHLRKPPIYNRVGIPGSGGPDWWRNDWEWVICATNGGRLPWSDNVAVGKACKYGPGGAPSHRLIDGTRATVRAARSSYVPPEKANPGNVIHVSVGGGKMGDGLAHESEAPFPEQLVVPFVRSFCPPGGMVFDPFLGSGTTVSVAKQCGRVGLGIELREGQCRIAGERLSRAVTRLLD